MKNAGKLKSCKYCGKEFEMRLRVVLDEATELDEAKNIVADYICNLPKDKILNALSCNKIIPVYPED